jgi:ATP-dependent protease HslVU (ClpYQ) peptidase subunit
MKQTGTCIVGYIDKEGVYIGGDSAAVSEDDLSYNIRTDEKVFSKGEFIFGFSTSFRMGQLLRYRFRIPSHPKGMENHQYMATLFIDAVKKCFIENDYADMMTEEGGSFMVGYKGKLYVILSDYQVAEPKENFAALGCGELIAMGAMYALTHADKEIQKTSKKTTEKDQVKRPEKDPLKRIEIALNAAVSFSMGVKPPFTYAVLLNKKRTTKK